MDDCEIVELYWRRDQSALVQSDLKYGAALEKASHRITGSLQDAQECRSDTLFSAWNRMPTDRPDYLGAYLMKILRNLSLDRWRRQHAEKRFAGQTLVFEELSECIPDGGGSVFDEMEKGALAKKLNAFLAGLEEEKRTVFLKRYFFSESIKEISSETGLSSAKIKSMLMRIRNRLAEFLAEENEG